MTPRIVRLRAALEERGFDAFLATGKPNQVYFAESLEANGYLLVTENEQTLFPGLWSAYACRDYVETCEVILIELGDPDETEQLIARLGTLGLRRVAVDHLSAELRERLTKEVAGTEFVEAPRLGADIRRKKEPRELLLIRQAAAISDAGIAVAFAAIRPGVSTRDVDAEGTATMMRLGCESVSMAVTIGQGASYLDGGNDPRHVIQAGDMVIIDMGIYYRGYIGDQTRSAIVGEGTPLQRDILTTIRCSQDVCREAIEVSARATDVYKVAADIVAKKGWRKYFVHHLSHGLGLGDDLPQITAESEDVLEAGDMMSCEPGVYIPQVGGARIENMVHLTERGPESLTHFTMDPVIEA